MVMKERSLWNGERKMLAPKPAAMGPAFKSLHLLVVGYARFPSSCPSTRLSGASNAEPVYLQDAVVQVMPTYDDGHKHPFPLPTVGPNAVAPSALRVAPFKSSKRSLNSKFQNVKAAVSVCGCRLWNRPRRA